MSATTLAPHGPQGALRAVRAASGSPGGAALPDALTAPLRSAAGQSCPAPEVPARPHALAGPHGLLDRAVLQFTAQGLTHRQIVHRTGATRACVNRSSVRLRAAYGAVNAAHTVALAIARGDIVTGRTWAPGLTGRQREVLALIAGGLTNAQIGRRLGVTESAVSWCIKTIMPVFGVAGRAHLVAEAYRAAVLVVNPAGRGLVLAGGEP